MRKSISKKVRFEVFKRDNFSCKYCGNNTGSGAVLNVDHVIPVAKGGTNDFANLVTACFDCNSGKSDRPLNTLSNHNPINKKNFLEYKAQVKAFFDYVKEKETATENLVDLVLKQIGNPATDFDVRQRQSIRVFLKKIDCEDLIHFSTIASAKLANRSPYTKFKYLCGICHNTIKDGGKSATH